MNVKRALKQKIVYWGNPTTDGYGGQTFDAAVEIMGRWEFVQKIFINANGEQQVSGARVYLSQDVDLDGYLYLGALTTIDSAGIPDAQSGAMRIKAFEKSPSVGKSNPDYVRKIWQM